MNELISDLLDLSLMETSDIDMEVIDLHDVIQMRFHIFRNKIRREWDIKKLKLRFLQIMMISPLLLKI